MKIVQEHIRILRAAVKGELYRTQHGRWRIANAPSPTFRCRRQLVQAGYLDDYHRPTDKGLQLLHARGISLLS